MWERFTTKKYYDSREIKNIGEIYTPWSSWLITASKSLLASTSEGDKRLQSFLTSVNKGIQHFSENTEESVRWIASNLDYTDEDAREWLNGVKFVEDTRVVEQEMVDKVVGILTAAGVVKEGVKADDVIFQV
jgi:hypothetical protein